MYDSYNFETFISRKNVSDENIPYAKQPEERAHHQNEECSATMRLARELSIHTVVCYAYHSV